MRNQISPTISNSVLKDGFIVGKKSAIVILMPVVNPAFLLVIRPTSCAIWCCVLQGAPTLWCQVLSRTNVFFGSRLPRAKRPSKEIIANEDHGIPLPEQPSLLQLEELRHISAPQILGTYQGQLSLADTVLRIWLLLAPSQLISALAYTLNIIYFLLIYPWLSHLPGARCT